MIRRAIPADRVARHTPADLNRRISRQTHDSIQYYERHRDEIPHRLGHLSREWDIERLLEANASTLVLVGLGLGAMVDRRFLIVSAVVAAFLLQHAIQGWCPPVPLLRRLGVRTRQEIEFERHALQDLAETSFATRTVAAR